MSRRSFHALAALLFAAVASCSSDSITDPHAPMNLKLRVSSPADTVFVSDTLTTADRVQLTLAGTTQGMPVSTPLVAEWTSSNPSVAVVDENGMVTPISLGTTKITARVNDERASATIVVARRAVQLSVSPSALTGLAGDTAIVTAAALDAGGVLVPGTAYDFSVSDPNTATITRTGNQTARVIFLKAGAVQVNVAAAGQAASATGTIEARDFVASVAGAMSGAVSGALTISAGEDATCGLLPLGRGYCFGREPLIGVAKDTSCFNDSNPPLEPCTLVPLRIAGALNLTSVSVGDSVACGVTSDTRAYCWGSQKYGQLGNGISSAGTSLTPSLVIGPVTHSAVSLTQVSAGSNHVCGLIPSGAAWCWGNDDAFQLGGGDRLHVNSTTPIPVAGGQVFVAITAGREHTCGLRADGAAYCWGNNSQGQLGGGTSGDTSDVPVAVAGGLVFKAISAGGYHTCALTTGGAAYCWGSDSTGQLGRGTGAGLSATPVAVVGGQSFQSIGAGRYSSCGITTGGAAYCWGSNEFAQIGNGVGRGGSVTSPTAVAGGHTDFVAVTVGRRHACAVGPSGAYCWGSNVLGALGDDLQALTEATPQKTATPQ